MKKLSQWVLKFRIAIIIATLLFTGVCTYLIKDLKINADIVSYLPKSDPVVALFNYIGKAYGGKQLAIIALETEEVFSKQTVQNIERLTKAFKLIPGISNILECMA